MVSNLIILIIHVNRIYLNININIDNFIIQLKLQIKFKTLTT